MVLVLMVVVVDVDVDLDDRAKASTRVYAGNLTSFCAYASRIRFPHTVCVLYKRGFLLLCIHVCLCASHIRTHTHAPRHTRSIYTMRSLCASACDSFVVGGVFFCV